MVVDPTIVGTGHRAQLDSAAFDLERLHLLGAMGGQAVLQIDAGKRRRELTKVSAPARR